MELDETSVICVIHIKLDWIIIKQTTINYQYISHCHCIKQSLTKVVASTCKVHRICSCLTFQTVMIPSLSNENNSWGFLTLYSNWHTGAEWPNFIYFSFFWIVTIWIEWWHYDHHQKCNNASHYVKRQITTNFLGLVMWTTYPWVFE